MRGSVSRRTLVRLAIATAADDVANPFGLAVANWLCASTPDDSGLDQKQGCLYRFADTS